VINWTVVGQLKVDNSSDGRPLVYHSDRQALSAARLRRAGSIATVDTACVLVSHSVDAAHKQSAGVYNV